MNLQKLYESKKTVYSMEVFPPKKSSSIDTIYNTLYGLRTLPVDFISVTYGAGGSAQQKEKTVEIASLIKSEYRIEPLVHLTCLNSTKDEVRTMLDHLSEQGLKNILVLRGDKSELVEPKHDFEHASDLVAFIKEKEPDFNVIGACYPEGHTEAKTLAADIRNLKTKVDAGASELISQLFFDNALFYRFLERCEIAGINVPIEAGIMPVTNKAQIERMVTMCGATLPIKFQRAIAKYGDTPESMRDIGIAYAVDQIADLLANGVDGIHVYTMNNPYIAKKIAEAVKTLL